jgi:xanthine dehydrogenase YagS FAD-binding subunit
MKEFQLVNATTLEGAVGLLKEKNGSAVILAGGTDVLGGLKRRIHPEYPEMVVNIGGIPGMAYIKEDDGLLKIGALTKVKDIAESALVKDKYQVLAEAAFKVASPHLRQMGTLAGNICQQNRCWYYWGTDNHWHCKEKGGARCYAAVGDNRYHSIFGGVGGCVGVNPSDIAPALVVLDANVVTTTRVIPAGEFWAMSAAGSTVLEAGEIVTEVQIPVPAPGATSTYLKFATRGSIDFPIVSCAVVLSSDDVRICLNAVHPNPYRAVKAEEVIRGKVIDEALAEAAGEAAVEGAKPLAKNKYKIQIAKTLVKRSILSCAGIDDPQS